DQVDDVLRHVHGVVGEAFEVPARERDVDGGLHAVLPLGGQQDVEEAAVESVHLVVVGVEFQAHLDVPGRDDAARLGDHSFGDLAHLQDGGLQLGRDRGLGVPAAGGLGDVDGEVAHAFEVAAHPQRGDEGAQVAR